MVSKNLLKYLKFILKKRALIPLVIIATFVLLIVFHHLAFTGRIFSNTFIAGVDVGGTTIDEASLKLSKSITTPDNVRLTIGDQEHVILLETAKLSYDYLKSSQKAFSIGRTGNVFFDIYSRFSNIIDKKSVGLDFTIDEKVLDQNLSVIAGEVSTDAVYPNVKLLNNSIVVDPGSAGTSLDINQARVFIGKHLSFANSVPLGIILKVVDPSLTPTEMSRLETRADNLLTKKLTLAFENSEFTYSGDEFFPYLDPNGEYNLEEIAKTIEEIATKIDKEPQNALFTFEGGRVREFLPSKNGVIVSTATLKDQLITALRTLEYSSQNILLLAIPVTVTKAAIQTNEVNSLGINELIGRGDSTFKGSIASRIHNIGLAAARFNGALVPPGETLSFNQILGDVSEYTGYKKAYVIKDGKTILGDGGGVCQVSTTLFRAALNAGLPIVERRPHSYRVGYYEQGYKPGLDATVYAPSTDLKIKNDTANHILVQTLFNNSARTLVFEIYGTSDGRTATISTPIISATSAPPDDLYQDDPTLAAGTIKQIEHKAWGAKVAFDYLVTRNGQTITQKTFYSNYRPWQAIYLRGTGPAN